MRGQLILSRQAGSPGAATATRITYRGRKIGRWWHRCKS